MFQQLTTALCLILLALSSTHAEDKKAKSTEDEGKQVIGHIQSTLYIGTRGDATKLGRNARAVPAATIKQLRSIKRMKFDHYRMLGTDKQPVFRSYENWLSPLKPSEEILLSFESRGRSYNGGLKLDLELWQMRRKVMKSDPTLRTGKPLFILGPKWRGGQLIIEVKLTSLNKSS